MTADKEMTAIQTWVKSITGLNSWLLKMAPTKLPRPVIIFDMRSPGTSYNMTRYEYVIPVRQYGRLCVNSVEEAQKYQGLLLADLGEKCNVVPVIEGSNIIRRLKNVQFDFVGQDLEGAFVLTYEVSYFRTRPAEAPHATRVVNRIVSDL